MTGFCASAICSCVQPPIHQITLPILWNGAGAVSTISPFYCFMPNFHTTTSAVQKPGIEDDGKGASVEGREGQGDFRPSVRLDLYGYCSRRPRWVGDSQSNSASETRKLEGRGSRRRTITFDSGTCRCRHHLHCTVTTKYKPSQLVARKFELSFHFCFLHFLGYRESIFSTYVLCRAPAISVVSHNKSTLIGFCSFTGILLFHKRCA